LSATRDKNMQIYLVRLKNDNRSASSYRISLQSTLHLIPSVVYIALGKCVRKDLSLITQLFLILI
jgi:hypothetical protein